VGEAAGGPLRDGSHTFDENDARRRSWSKKCRRGLRKHPDFGPSVPSLEGVWLRPLPRLGGVAAGP
jgi:hypothetical protein